MRSGSLLLDPKNARIPANRRSEEQRRLLHELLETENIKDLAASIAKLGLFPNERLVVMPDTRRGRYVVLEGNRRLAAIKLLLNPDLAPTTPLVSYFRRLAERADLRSLSQLEVVVVPNRLAAAPIIAALHTREAKRRWSSLQQARFYRELVDEGKTAAEVAEDLGVTLGHVQSYLRAEKLYRLALTLEYPPPVQKKLHDSRFPLTTLERFLESKVGRRFLGIELDDQGSFRGVVHPDRFKAVLARVAEDVATEKGLTRRINDETGFQQYKAEAEAKLPKTRLRGSFTVDSLLGIQGKTDNGTQEGAPPKKRREPTPSKSIVPRGFKCTSKHERVRAVFKELRDLNIVQHPNATGVMFRVLLDIALWSYVKDNGHAEAVCDHCDPTRKRRRNDPNWTPPLRDLISYAVENRVFPDMTPDGYKATRLLASREPRDITTIDTFNQFTHNPYVTPTEADLRALWQRAQPMLEIILD